MATLCPTAAANAPDPSFTQLLSCYFDVGPFPHHIYNCVACHPLSKLPQEGLAARTLDRARGRGKNAWHEFLADVNLYSPILDIGCDLLALTPRPQWWEALRLRGLPQVPARITLTDSQVWQYTREAFEQHRATDVDCLHAATQLLFDAGLWLIRFHNERDQSPFAMLENLTRGVDSPALRIAHCIRDIAYGDKSRVDDLIAMAQSEEPSYRQIFEEAFWRNPEESKSNTPLRKQRKR